MTHEGGGNARLALGHSVRARSVEQNVRVVCKRKRDDNDLADFDASALEIRLAIPRRQIHQDEGLSVDVGRGSGTRRAGTSRGCDNRWIDRIGWGPIREMRIAPHARAVGADDGDRNH